MEHNRYDIANLFDYIWAISPDDVNNRLDNFQREITKTERMNTVASVIATYSNGYLTNQADLLMVSHDPLTRKQFQVS